MLENTKMKRGEISTAQAAEEYELRRRTINEWVRRGHFKARFDRYTNRWFFKRSDFEAFLKKDRPVGRPPKKADGGETS